jgi:SAM-dependent methyltransferase
MMGAQAADRIREGIAEKYRKVALSPAGVFRYPTGEESARVLGYASERISAIPRAIRERFVGVGNPFSLGPIASGEAVLDLGCGAGFDTLVAAQLVGPTGRVVGIACSAQAAASRPVTLGWSETSRPRIRLSGPIESPVL